MNATETPDDDGVQTDNQRFSGEYPAMFAPGKTTSNPAMLVWLAGEDTKYGVQVPERTSTREAALYVLHQETDVEPRSNAAPDLNDRKERLAVQQSPEVNPNYIPVRDLL